MFGDSWSAASADGMAVVASDRFNTAYYDTAVFSTPLLRRLVEDVGPGHVLLGTDHPFELGDTAPLDTVRDLGLDAAGAVLWDSAAALLGLTAGAAGTG